MAEEAETNAVETPAPAPAVTEPAAAPATSETAPQSSASAEARPTDAGKPGIDGYAKPDTNGTTTEDQAESKTDPAAAAPAAEDKAESKDNGTNGADAEDDAKEATKDPNASAKPVVSSSKKTRPPYKHDPTKITLRFIFANRDGLTVTVECKPADTVGEVKGALLSVWPDDLPKCAGGEYLRLICMGKGMLMPDTRTLDDCQIPVFKTHPTPVNVSVRPATMQVTESSTAAEPKARATTTTGTPATTEPAEQGCACLIL